jgi:hypothetical protein
MVLFYTYHNFVVCLLLNRHFKGSNLQYGGDLRCYNYLKIEYLRNMYTVNPYCCLSKNNAVIPPICQQLLINFLIFTHYTGNNKLNKYST